MIWSLHAKSMTINHSKFRSFNTLGMILSGKLDSIWLSFQIIWKIYFISISGASLTQGRESPSGSDGRRSQNSQRSRNSSGRRASLSTAPSYADRLPSYGYDIFTIFLNWICQQCYQLFLFLDIHKIMVSAHWLLLQWNFTKDRRVQFAQERIASVVSPQGLCQQVKIVQEEIQLLKLIRKHQILLQGMELLTF